MTSLGNAIPLETVEQGDGVLGWRPCTYDLVRLVMVGPKPRHVTKPLIFHHLRFPLEGAEEYTASSFESQHDARQCQGDV